MIKNSKYSEEIIQEINNLVQNLNRPYSNLLELTKKYVFEIIAEKQLLKSEFDTWFNGIKTEFLANVMLRREFKKLNIQNIYVEDPKCEVLGRGQGDSGDIHIKFKNLNISLVLNCKSKKDINASFKNTWWEVKKDNQSDIYLFFVPDGEDIKYCGFKRNDQLNEDNLIYLKDLNNNIKLFIEEILEHYKKMENQIAQFN